MYTANPRVNVELRQRLPSPARQQRLSPDRLSLTPDPISRPQAPGPSQYFQESPTSCSLSPRSIGWSSRPQIGIGEMEVDLSPSQGPSPRAETCNEGPDGSPAFRRHLVNSEDSCRQDAIFGPAEVSEETLKQQNRNVSLLLKELDTLRGINKKLRDQLIQREEELQKKEVEEQLREEQREARDWERPAALLQEVLSSQKDRDQALMSRLLLANEERDEALVKTQRLQQEAELEKTKLDDSDMEVDQLLQCVCDAESVQEVQRFGSVLVQRVKLARQRRNDITAQEMKAVMEERDGSIAKFKRLEQELMQEREKRNKEEQLRLQRDQDATVEDRCLLEVELQTIGTNHSSQGLLTSPPSNAADYRSVAGSLQAPPPPVQLSKDKKTMEAELQRCQEAEREASDRVRRLERLVEVLRRKVGAGSLRSVI